MLLERFRLVLYLVLSSAAALAIASVMMFLDSRV